MGQHIRAARAGAEWVVRGLAGAARAAVSVAVDLGRQWGAGREAFVGGGAAGAAGAGGGDGFLVGEWGRGGGVWRSRVAQEGDGDGAVVLQGDGGAASAG